MGFILQFGNIHKLDIIHQNFHPGNILSSNFKSYTIKISDFGLSKLMGQIQKIRKKEYFWCTAIYCSRSIKCDEEYTKAADVYSFGIIAYEIDTGFPPYPDIPYDKDLAMKICNGLRPKIPFHTHKLITRLIMRKNKDSEIVIQIKKAEEFSENQELTNRTTPFNYRTHPQAIYAKLTKSISDLWGQRDFLHSSSKSRNELRKWRCGLEFNHFL
ncbi:hypothetical protein Glove_233g32 [Diversispora epigaea]|uniref:Protein kinase domain-containing protein n=1 Tax=Diversispora epigaea TaxID=1348612 RepID=A0A397IBL0_9GLOM|nr:hypothetical protein Glove_233g32 [Diversispora epigaea]